jgi:transcriptional regulator with XRE-family HTH domain
MRVIITAEVILMNKLDNSQIRKKFGENIRALRKSRGYSQMKFAETIGFDVTQAAVSAWEVGIREPELCVIFGIADRFNVPVSSLIPLDESGNDDDMVQKVVDLLQHNPRLCATIDKAKYFDEKQMNVVISVIDAIAKESDAE